MRYTIKELCFAIQGTAKNVSSEQIIHSFSINSRTLQAGDWFVCIVGDRTDGHQYIQHAIEQGAAGVIANLARIPSHFASTVPQIFVQDPNLALRQWAGDYRQRFKGTIIGITGSNGKTSTKELCQQLCHQLDANSHATQGNYNNFIGVPLTLLAAPLDTHWWIVEMGTNYFGEIATLSQLVQPSVAILNHIGESHLENLKNTQGVAKEKSGLFQGMKEGSPVAIPANLLHREIVHTYALKQKIRLLDYGIFLPKEKQTASYPAVVIEQSPQNCRFILHGYEFQISWNNPLLLKNLIGVLLILRESGLSWSQLQQATQHLHPKIKGRMQFLENENFLLVDDSYNANPSSFQSAVDVLRMMFPDRRLTVIAGDMAELGRQSPEFHYKMGKYCQQAGCSSFWCIGQFAADYCSGWDSVADKASAAKTFTTKEELVFHLRNSRQDNDIILVKGSRSAKMEQVVHSLLE